MGTNFLKIIFLSFLGISIFLLQPLTVLGVTIMDVRLWAAPDHTRIVLDLTGPIQYESSSQESPPQFQLELKGGLLKTLKKEMEVKDPCVTKISLIELGKDRVKLILHQKKPLKTNVFFLKPYQDKTHRLVIDLIDVVQEKKELEERQRQKEIKPKGTKIVVIDPGHGGEDPGAVGPKKTMEKEIVLKVGEKVVHLLNQNKEIQAFLTRKGDYFIPLEERIKIGREYGTDLLVSLHTDGSFNPQARGSSVYCLSLSGATDEAAKILADKENTSNILGGAFLRPAAYAKDPNLNQILLDLMQNNSMKESFRLAETILEDIKAVNPLKYPSYRQANFIVLKAPDFPSVLVEMAFITNKEDERLLNHNDFQEKIARTLSTSIKKHFKP
ncbi:MAG: N-acetylmuramoyl-L-alanine amidase [Deltaproteobacteria bacterium]|jgi:N-acetylmuramoyl-L-alanine amidase|nr:N-acetylmuramoyl-L-alanine amidase [Deltaproteobacteria bacterium]